MNGVYIVVILVVLFFVYTYNSGPVTVYRFYKPSCPFCVNSQEEWNKFQNNPGNTMRVVAVDTSLPQNQHIARRYSVRTVPHIVGIRGWKRRVYTGDRTAVDLRKWANGL